jgi:hypothetical protein
MESSALTFTPPGCSGVITVCSTECRAEWLAGYGDHRSEGEGYTIEQYIEDEIPRRE